MSIKVAIVEDNSGIRESLSILINGANGFACSGAYPSAESCLKEISQNWPDVIIMDINLPKMSGVECVLKLKQLNPALHVLMFTVDDDSDPIFASLQAGATGYLVKDTPPAEILEAVTDLHRGGAPMSPHIARKVVQFFQRGRPEVKPSKALEELSEREMEIVTCLAKGFRYKEIAEALSISVHTVRSHIRRIYEKLHVTSRTEATLKLGEYPLR